VFSEATSLCLKRLLYQRGFTLQSSPKGKGGWSTILKTRVLRNHIACEKRTQDYGLKGNAPPVFTHLSEGAWSRFSAMLPDLATP